MTVLLIPRLATLQDPYSTVEVCGPPPTFSVPVWYVDTSALSKLMAVNSFHLGAESREKKTTKNIYYFTQWN